METIFQKIIAREIPASIIYEDDLVLAFLDIRPSNKGHALIVPKRGFETVFDGDGDTLAHMMRAAQKIAHALKTTVQAEGVNIIMNNGSVAGQEIMHAHLHVIPRYEGDEVFKPPKHVSYEDGEADVLAEKIKAAIA